MNSAERSTKRNSGAESISSSSSSSSTSDASDVTNNVTSRDLAQVKNAAVVRVESLDQEPVRLRKKKASADVTSLPIANSVDTPTAAGNGKHNLVASMVFTCINIVWNSLTLKCYFHWVVFTHRRLSSANQPSPQSHQHAQ